MKSVLDTSAILAIVRGEAGSDRALQLSGSAMINAANVAEAVTKCVELNLPEEIALTVIQSCGLEIVDLDYDLAVLTGTLVRKARKGVLSLGDRACIATAIRHNGIAVTADRIWATLDLGCPVELIR